MIVDRGIFMTFALAINKNASRQSVRELQKASFQRALKAGAKIAFAVIRGRIRLLGFKAPTTCCLDR